MSEEKTIVCFACGAVVPDIEGPTHPYMLSAPGCWQLYGEILAKEYAPETYDASSHRITVDAYAVTHPGNEGDKRAINSVTIHLIRLYYYFEKDFREAALLQVMKNAADNVQLHNEFIWLTPPAFDQTLHITDVLTATNFEEHKKMVQTWGKSVWKVWKDQHFSTINMLAQKV